MSISSLTQLYTTAGLFLDGDGDGLPDGLRVRFSAGTNPGAIDVAARLGLESAGLSLGFTAPDAQGIPVRFGPDNPECPKLSGLLAGHGTVQIVGDGLVVTGADPAAGWMAARWLAETFPYLAPGGGRTLAEDAAGRAVYGVIIEAGRVLYLLWANGAVEAVDKPTVTGPATEPPFRPEPIGDLPPEGPDRLFTVAGLLGSSDGI